MERYTKVKQYVVPFVFPLFFTMMALVLPLAGQGKDISLSKLFEIAHRFDKFALWTVVVYLTWAILWLKIPSKKVYGPTTSFRQTPSYQGNGLEYYIASMVLIFMVYYVKPQWAVLAYKLMPELVALLNLLALITCALITARGVLNPKYREKIEAPPQLLFNVVYRFWCGSELHPNIWGIDIKQLIISRLGLMIWQQLIIAFFVASLSMYGFSLPLFYNVFLQSVYLMKFFAWESGYFHTIDIIEDRASYYLCWGSAVWVPVLYTWSTYYIVGKQSSLTSNAASIIAALGLISIILNYLIDLEKQVFRRTGKSFLPGQTSSLKVTYKDDTGKTHKTALLTSGFWGSARHLNYTMEIALSACWCLEGWGTGLLAPYFYVIFLTALLAHRFYRDHMRCLRKYGDKQWGLYCRAVPYWFIPYIF